MFHKTFDMASDQDDGTVPRGLQLTLSSEQQYCSPSMLASPDSNSSISIMSDIEAGSSPDVLESCLPECSPVDNLHNTTLTKHDMLCGATMNVNQTFAATAVSDSMNFWNENLSLMSSGDSGSQKYLTFCKYSEGESFEAAAPPFSARKDSQMSSCETSCRGSTENDCCSVSSGEMIVRNNSFCLEDQPPMGVLSLDESISATDNIGALPDESDLLSMTPPVIGENSSEGIAETKNNCLNMTFTRAIGWDCPAEDNNVALSSDNVELPSENAAGLSMTFTCEASASHRKGEKFAGTETEPLPETWSAVAQEQSKTIVNTDSAVRERDRTISTSTPEEIITRRRNVPSFPDSHCRESPGSVRDHVGRKQNCVAPKQCAVAGQTFRANKARTVQIKKFPKSDFSNIKSKIVTRASPQRTAPGSTSQRKAPQAEIINRHVEAQRTATKNGTTPTKVRRDATVVSTKPKTVDSGPSGINTGGASVCAPLSEPSALNEQGASKGSQSDYQPAASDRAPAARCSDATCENEQTTRVISSKNEVRSGSALGRNKPSAMKRLLRCSSEGSSVSLTPRSRTNQEQTKKGNLKSSTQRELALQTENSPREVNRESLVDIGKSATSEASGDGTESRFNGKLPSRPTREPLLSQGSVGSPKLTPARLRLGGLGVVEFRTPKAGAKLPLKPEHSTGSYSAPLSLRTHSAAGSRPQLNGSRPPQTSTGPSLSRPPFTPSWRPSRKTPGHPNGPTKAVEQGDGIGIKQVSRGAGPKQTPLKAVPFKSKLFSTSAKLTKPALTPACTPSASTSKAVSNSTPGFLKRSASARQAVDKSKAKAGSRQQPSQPPASKSSQSCRTPGSAPPANVAEDERRGRINQQLKGLLAASNCRFEAVTIVLQQSLAERDEATKQCRELSQELVSLQGELACSVSSSERLEKEKEGLRASLEDALHRVQEQHQKDLADLEQRLQAFYQAEWNKMHAAYQEEADKCSAVMQQQMGELTAKHESMKLDLENSHVEQLQSVKQQYENSLDELRQVHNQELQSLKKTLNDAEASLSGRIQELTEENNALIEKLTAEENRRKELAQKSQKDSHTLYLEQELESLKVVLDIKTTQLHQQEKKLMEIDKLTEKNMQLDEILKKVQQENEDLKARMERHAALSRQLSSEQAVLQESLQKESKVNKRLSMENEELLWKLNNNDLSNPRRASPTSSASSPSHSFSLQSPRSSGLYSSPPVSPR
ncbi:unnamed protein product [Ophioblennius macclurei]